MDILNYCILSANGRILFVPDSKSYKVGKDEYKQFKQTMLNVGGKWEGNQQFSFPYNATSIMERLKLGESVDFRKYQLFPTPPRFSRIYVGYAGA